MKLFVQKIFFTFSIIITFNTQAEIYKCVKEGKTTYSEKPCDGVGHGISKKTSYPGLLEGMAAFESGNYVLAYSQLNPLAESGVAIAQNAVGRMYLQGQGVPANPDIAMILFIKAAKQGLPNAKNNLGVMYADGKAVRQDYKQAIVWFKEAADQGFGLAMNNLADMYENGLGVKPNHEEAVKWRKKSQGSEIVTNSTPVVIETAGKKEYDEGLEYYHGWNFVEAAKWFEQAAIKGHPEAQLKLASLFEHGQGVIKSEEQAQYWMQKARNGAHTMNDKRDRVILIDASSGNYTPPTPRIEPAISNGTK